MSLSRDLVVKVLLRDRLRVMSIATAIVRDVHAADDIFQQVVLSALEVSETFHDPGHVLAWAIRAAKHRSIDLAHRKRLLSLPDEILDQMVSAWSDPTSPVCSDQAEALQRCLGKLAAYSRNVLRLRYADGMSAPAIASELNRSSDAVYQTLSRVHRSLKQCVERELQHQGQLAGGDVS